MDALKHFLTCILFFTPLPLVAADMAAGGATYDGDNLTLTEGVELNHPYGKVTAQSMIVQPESNNSHLSLSRVQLFDDVHFTLKDGSVASGAYADLDAIKREGYLSGKDTEDRISYVGVDGLQLSSIDVSVKWDTKHTEDFLGGVTDVVCNGDVQVSFGNSIKAIGDIAHYHKKAEDANEEMIILQSKTEEGFCTVTDNAGGCLKTPELIYYPKRALVVAKTPHGTSTIAKGQEVSFRSGKATWNLVNNQLSLEGGTVFAAKNYGEVIADGPVDVFRENNEWQYLVTEGRTELLNRSSEEFVQRQLLCNGCTTFDHAAQHITMIAMPDTKIEYKDENARLSGKRLDVSYVSQMGTTTLQNISLTGDVRLINNTLPSDPNGESKPWQYVLAERFEYLPQEHLCFLTSPPPKRVYYYDKLNSIQASAPRIFIEQQSNGKFAIRAVGAARFAFAERELEALHKQFQRRGRGL